MTFTLKKICLIKIGVLSKIKTKLYKLVIVYLFIMAHKKDPLKIIGIILIILGVLIILSAFPLIQQTIFPGVETLAKKVSPINATRIIIGLIISVLGLVIYLGKEGLKILSGN